MRLTTLILIHLLLCDVVEAQNGFTKVTDANNPATNYQLPAQGGIFQGVCWIDADNDRDIDLFVAPNRLFLNEGNGNFSFKNTGFEFGVLQQPAGATWSDMDNDGDIDCVLAGTPSKLYLNDGTANFTSKTLTNQTISGWGNAFGDGNNDGWVDLVIAHAINFLPNPSPSFYFLNDKTGMLNPSPITYDFMRDTAPYTVPYWSDFDLDGDLDLFIASGPGGSPGPDFHYRNLKIETGKDSLARIANLPFATQQQDGQCYNFIDYDNDGDLDACLTNWGGASNRFYENQNGNYVAKTTPFTTTNITSLANCWGDFDNDGDLDVIITNAGQFPTVFYRNNGQGNFEQDNAALALQNGGTSVAACDYDNDGDLDFHLHGNLTGRALYQNTTLVGNNNWVNITCVGTTSNRSAIGAKLRLKATINGRAVWQLREISAQNTFQGQNDLRVHFGLGDATRIDSLEICYLGGATDVFTNLAPNLFYLATERNSMITSAREIAANRLEGFKVYPNPALNYVILEQTHPLPDQKAICTIFDISGKIINQQTIADSVGQQVRLDLTRLASAHFLVAIKVGAKQQVFKLVRQ
ncbi:MAG: FG-GAP-like repeat-containing protein [Saprospiraceae bacterium]